MKELLIDIHNKSEQMPGRKVLLSFIAIFIVFLFIGILIGNIVSKSRLTEDEILEIAAENGSQVAQSVYEGKVEYVNPSFYPKQGISYALMDGSGNQILLLRSEDQKLNIVEGLFVKVTGVLSKTTDGKSHVLNVAEVTIKNATN